MLRVADIQELMQTCVEAGFLRGQMALLPSSDKIPKRDAEDLLRRFGFQKVMLQKWVAEGLIKEHGGNGSHIWYSRLQLIEMVGAVQYKRVVDNSEV